MSYQKVCKVSMSRINDSKGSLLLSSSNLLSLMDDVLDKVINEGWVLANSSSTFSSGTLCQVLLVKAESHRETKAIQLDVPGDVPATPVAQEAAEDTPKPKATRKRAEKPADEGQPES